MPKLTSIMCRRESCACGAPAAHKVVEHIFPDDPNSGRPPLSTFLCRRHFGELMGPVACDILAGQREPSRSGKPSALPTEKPVEPKSINKSESLNPPAELIDRLPLLVGVRRARELLGIGNTTIYKLINSGKIRTVKIGGRTLIETAVLRALASTGV